MSSVPAESETNINRGPMPTILCVFFIATVLLPAHAAAATATLMWDQNTEPEVAGYKVLYGTSSRQYVSSRDVGAQTWTQITVADSPATYYFAVQAYTRTGLHSPLSTEISWSVVGGVPASPVTLTSLTADKAAPQPTGTSITFTAAASGGIAPIQYKWWTSPDGANWTLGQGWSTTNTYRWTPTLAGPSFRVRVWARSADSLADTLDNPLAGQEMPFAIAASPLGVTLAAVKLGQRAVFTASVSGTGTYHYKWWMYDGTAWTLRQNWSTSNKFTWKSSSTSASHRMRVWVRRSTSVADAPEGTAEQPFPTQK